MEGTHTVTVYDVKGARVLSAKASGSGSIATRLPHGIYLAVVSDGSHSTTFRLTL